MIILQNIISPVLLFCLISALPIGEDNVSIRSNNSLRSSEKTNIWGLNNLGRNGVTDESMLWPNGTIPYMIEGPYSSDEIDMIRQAMDTIEFWTCARFIPYNGEHDFIAIQDATGYGCKAQIGHIGGQQLVFLEAPECVIRIGTIMHELLHVLGIIHEHNRPDRDLYINITRENMAPGRNKSFDKVYGIYNDSNTNDYGIPYDYSSIMHYSEYSGSYNGLKTIQSKFGAPLGQRDGLTIRDVLKIMRMYNCHYVIDNTEHSSKLLPNANETWGTKAELWNTFFRNFNYTHS